MAHYLHEQLTHSLLKEMASGVYRNGQRFLSLRTIGRMWGVSEPTILSSLRKLTEWGLLRPEARRGYFLRIGFQEKAELLLRRNRLPPLRPMPSLQQKLRLIQKIEGGKIAVLLETVQPPPQQEYLGIPPQISPSVSRCAMAFEQESRRHGFELRWFLYDGGAASASWVREQLERGEFQGAAAFCRSSFKVTRPMLEPMMRKHLPIVIMYDDCQGLPVNSINLNNVGLGYDAIRHLYKAGHRRIAILARRLPKTHEKRIKGCLLARSEGGCSGADLKIFYIPLSGAIPRDLQRLLWHPSERPTAVFACSSRVLAHVSPLLQGQPVPPSVIVCSSRSNHSGLGIPVDCMDLNVASKIGRTAARSLKKIQSGESLEKSIFIDVVYKRHEARASKVPRRLATGK